MTQRVEGGVTYTQVFDAENRLVSVTVNGEITQFVYDDGNGAMVKKINPDGSKTIYVGGLYEVDKSSGGSVTRTVTYYPAAGATLAPHCVCCSAGVRIDGTLYYNLKDHLGSASVTTDASGNIVGEQRYNPYGETRLPSGSMFTDKLFTGQREMAGLGIYHYGARFYSPKLARFISADTIVPGASNPQAFNRYSYVFNNPLRYIDPTGHMPNVTPVQCDLDCWRDLYKDDDDSGSSSQDCVVCDVLIGVTNVVLQITLGGHQYEVGPSPVCLPLSWINCTPEESNAYLAGSQFPGQLPWQPVQPHGSYNVFPEKIGNSNLLGRWVPGSGAIYVEFGDHQISNIAFESHVFYTGYVGRTSYVGAYGMTYVETYGEGYNDGFEISGYNVPGWVIDQANNAVGPIAFKALNLQLILYTTWVETGQALTGTQQP